MINKNDDRYFGEDEHYIASIIWFDGKNGCVIVKKEEKPQKTNWYGRKLKNIWWFNLSIYSNSEDEKDINFIKVETDWIDYTFTFDNIVKDVSKDDYEFLETIWDKTDIEKFVWYIKDACERWCMVRNSKKYIDKLNNVIEERKKTISFLESNGLDCSDLYKEQNEALEMVVKLQKYL